MNKEQYKKYRRNQRCCYNDEYGWPDNTSDYFEKIPYVQAMHKFHRREHLYQEVARWTKAHLGAWKANVRYSIKLNIQGGF